MKINSNTIKLEKNDYENITNLIKKIADINNINNVETIKVNLTKDNGIISFKIAQLPEEEDDLYIDEGEKLYTEEEKFEKLPERSESELVKYLLFNTNKNNPRQIMVGDIEDSDLDDDEKERVSVVLALGTYTPEAFISEEPIFEEQTSL